MGENILEKLRENGKLCEAKAIHSLAAGLPVKFEKKIGGELDPVRESVTETEEGDMDPPPFTKTIVVTVVAYALSMDGSSAVFVEEKGDSG